MDDSTEATADKVIASVDALTAQLASARQAIGEVFFGQDDVIDQVLIALLSGGHALLVGVPGLGKTRLVETLGQIFGLQSKRIQFTPDLMPADILGAEVLDMADDGSRHFRFVEGPIFTQLLMADEINRGNAGSRRRKTRLSRKAPIPCQKRSWIASCSIFACPIPTAQPKPRS